MGASDFVVSARGKTAREAFKNAREEAAYEFGHCGYTGTIAEKSSFTMIELPAGEDAWEFAQTLIDKEDKRIDDKWGPAGCIALEKDLWLFFGWASS